MKNTWILKTSKLQSAKVHLPNNQIRRIPIEGPLSLPKLVSSALSYLTENDKFDQTQPKILYQDNEKDWVICDTDEEFQEMLYCIENNEVLTLQICCKFKIFLIFRSNW